MASGTSEASLSYVPWRRHTLLTHLSKVDMLLDNSHFPIDIDSSLDNPIMCAAYESLHSAASCRICRLLFELAESSDLPDAFLEEYALLCYYCLHAPICWSSGLMAAADLCHLLDTHFSAQINQSSIFQIGGITGIDIQLHFFINRCFKAIHPDKTYVNANLSFLKLEFLRANLVGSMSTQLCFKTVWRTLSPEEPEAAVQRGRKRDWRGGSCKRIYNGTTSCCTWIKKTQGLNQPLVNNSKPDQPQAISRGRGANACDDKVNIQKNNQCTLDIFVRCWRESELLKKRKCLGDIELTDLSQYVPPCESDSGKGPCLLTPMANLKHKNQTFSTCLLCEMLSTHPHAKYVLEVLQNEILTRILNNMKLVDRVSLVLADFDFLQDLIQDSILLPIIRSLTAHEVYKHFFCDPLCILNTIATSTDVLFKERNEEELTELKRRLAIGDASLITVASSPRCDHLESLSLIFKSVQNFPVQKTTFLDILREIDASLADHQLQAVQSVQTAHLYV